MLTSVSSINEWEYHEWEYHECETMTPFQKKNKNKHNTKAKTS